MGQPDAAALVPTEVDHYAAAFIGDRTQRLFELIAAVAAQRSDDVASEAFAVHPHQGTVTAAPGGCHITEDQREVFDAVDAAPVTTASKCPNSVGMLASATRWTTDSEVPR